MARPLKSNKYDSKQIQEEFIEAVVEEYTGLTEGEGNDSIRRIAAEFDMTPLKVRKLLITAGVFHTEVTDEINDLFSSGKCVKEIQKITGLSYASVSSYLPYTKIVYNLRETSLNAERIAKYRKRKAAVVRIKEEKYTSELLELQEIIWDTLILFEGYSFYTYRGLKFAYEIRGGEIFVNRKDKSITRSSVNKAVNEVIGLKWNVADPMKLGVFGTSYLYPIFIRIGLIDY